VSSEPVLYRTLNRCAVCSRQWDVSFLKPGELVRCECGTTFEAEFRAPRSPRALRCTSCGANLAANATSCGYCKAELALEDRGISSICPGCWSRLPARAKHCLECGLAIEPQALQALPASSRCPRCKSALRSRIVDGHPIVECGSCAGLWLAPHALDRMCERTEEESLSERALRAPPPAGKLAPEVVRYLPCVVCGELMLRRNFATCSGVIVDVCKEHGVWLDPGELERILAFVRDGGLLKARAKELDRLRVEEERVRDKLEDARRDERWFDETLPGSRRGSLRPGLADLGNFLWGLFG
jgi:Zn-finger nucleic acid-binding protein